jgi:hypothetical protein
MQRTNSYVLDWLSRDSVADVLLARQSLDIDRRQPARTEVVPRQKHVVPTAKEVPEAREDGEASVADDAYRYPEPVVPPDPANV